MAYFVSDSVLSIEKFTEGKTKLLPQEAYTLIKTVAIKELYINLNSSGNIDKGITIL